MITKVTSFFSQVIVEMRKVTWPTRHELIDATWIVVISAALLGTYIAGTDFILSRFLGLLIK